MTTAVPALAPARRYWIVGPPGAGKSTLAARLAARVGVPPTHLDELYWKPGWVASSDDEFLARLAPVLARPAWVIDGNYRRLCDGLAVPVDLFVWLDLPLRVAFPRLLARTADRVFNRRPCCNGNRETLWQALATRDSILYYSLRTHHRYARRYTREMATRPHVRLRSAAAVDAWLRTVPARAE